MATQHRTQATVPQGENGATHDPWRNLVLSYDTTHGEEKPNESSAHEPSSAYDRAFAYHLQRMHKRPTLGVDLVSHCNLNCAYCFHYSPIAEPGLLLADDFERDLVLLAKIEGVEEFFDAICLMGGEPLLHPRLADLVQLTLILLAKDVSYVVLNVMEPLFLPLHICNFCEYAALAYALWPRTRVGRCAADILFCWGTTGCAAALFLPAWGPYCPAWSLASLCGFAEHALALGCALCLVLGGDYVPRPRRVWIVVAASVTCGLAFRVLNPILGTNFFFVTDPSTMGVPGTWILQTFGDPWFLVAYLFVAFCLWTVVFGIWSLCNRHTSKR